MINPVLMIAVPLGLAFISLIFKKASKWLLAAGIASNVIMLFFLEQGATAIGGFRLPYGIELFNDGYSMAGLAVVNLLFLAVIMVSFDKVGKNPVVLLTALAGMNGMILTHDIFNLFIFLEITAISAYILSMKGKRPEHSFNYLVLGSVGSVLFLLGMIIIYSMTGMLNMHAVSVSLGSSVPGNGLLLLPMFLIFAGMAVEAKLIPFGGWVKGVFGNADRLTGPLFSSVYAAAILFALGRVISNVFVGNETMNIIIVIIGLITFAFGEAAAFRQSKMRRILLFSSIGQSGLAVALMAMGLQFPAMLIIINNVIGKFIMFIVTSRLNETYKTEDYKELKGAFYKNKLTGVAFSIGALSLIGLPLFFGFYAKMNALTALFVGGNWFVPAVILIFAIVEGAYFIRLLINLWAPGKEGEYAKAEHAVGELKLFGAFRTIVVVILSLLILAAGLFPDFAGKFIAPEAEPAFTINQLKGGE